MAKYQTKADKAFDLRLGTAIKNRDWSYVEELFLQYGGYLVLTAEDPAAIAKQVIDTVSAADVKTAQEARDAIGELLANEIKKGEPNAASD